LTFPCRDPATDLDFYGIVNQKPSGANNTMKSRLVKLIGIILAVGIAGVQPQPTYANVNIQGSSCQPFAAGAGGVDIFAAPTGMWFQAPAFAAIAVTCSLPHSPLLTASASLRILIDGDNPNSAPTSCTLYSYDWSGTFLGSVTAASSSTFGLFTLDLSLPAAQVPYWAYTSVACLQGGGSTVHGITLLDQSLAQ
jgi:hypothetical protein